MLSPVQLWPDVPAGQNSPTHYLVLDISPDEQDPRVIEEAALDRAASVRAYQLTHGPQCTWLLGQIALALITLLDPAKRREYDRSLGEVARSSESSRRTPTPAVEPGCDVQLVCRQW
jgi:hypothetical protein